MDEKRPIFRPFFYSKQRYIFSNYTLLNYWIEYREASYSLQKLFCITLTFIFILICIQSSVDLFKNIHWCSNFIYMLGSSQPQHFFAAGCVFADFAIAVIFYPVIKTLWKLLCPLFEFCHTQILNLRAKINFANMVKIIQKSSKFRVWPNFQTIFNIFAKLIFALKFDVWVWQHPSNMHRNFYNVFIRG